eukprot:COSAG06_NODE_2045_length_7751_cov_1.725039_3_plen_81_part_00
MKYGPGCRGAGSHRSGSGRSSPAAADLLASRMSLARAIDRLLARFSPIALLPCSSREGDIGASCCCWKSCTGAGMMGAQL